MVCEWKARSQILCRTILFTPAFRRDRRYIRVACLLLIRGLPFHPSASQHTRPCRRSLQLHSRIVTIHGVAFAGRNSYHMIESFVYVMSSANRHCLIPMLAQVARPCFLMPSENCTVRSHPMLFVIAPGQYCRSCGYAGLG